MNDESKPHERKIIPFKRNNFVEKKSDGNQYKLGRICKPRKKQIKILFGEGKSNITEAFEEYIKIIMEDKYDLKFFCAVHSSKILRISNSESIDIYILIVNNIICDHISLGNWLEESLDLIKQIKTIYRKPVIALSGMDRPEYDSVHVRTQYAADFFFFMPFRFEMFGEAIQICLNMHPDFNQESE